MSSKCGMPFGAGSIGGRRPDELLWFGVEVRGQGSSCASPRLSMMNIFATAVLNTVPLPSRRQVGRGVSR